MTNENIGRWQEKIKNGIEIAEMTKDLIEAVSGRDDEKKRKEVTSVNESKSEQTDGSGKPASRLASMMASLQPQVSFSPRLIEEDSRTVVDWGLRTSVNLPGDLDSILVGAVSAVLRQVSK
jgi:hypothetical protein